MKREGGGEFKGLGYICNAGKRAELMYSGVAESIHLLIWVTVCKEYKNKGVAVEVSPEFHGICQMQMKSRVWMSTNHDFAAGCIQ